MTRSYWFSLASKVSSLPRFVSLLSELSGRIAQIPPEIDLPSRSPVFLLSKGRPLLDRKLLGVIMHARQRR